MTLASHGALVVASVGIILRIIRFWHRIIGHQHTQGNRYPRVAYAYWVAGPSSRSLTGNSGRIELSSPKVAAGRRPSGITTYLHAFTAKPFDKYM